MISEKEKTVVRGIRIPENLLKRCDEFITASGKYEWTFARLVRRSLEMFLGGESEKKEETPKKAVALRKASAKKEEKDLALNNAARNVLGAYALAFKNRYGANPTLRGKDAGAALRLLKDIAEERLSQMVQVYVQMDDKWFLTRKHDFDTFEKNINKISVALQTGVDDSRKKTSYEEFQEYKKQDEIRKAALRGERLPK